MIESSSDLDDNELDYENDSDNDNDLILINKKTKNKLKLVSQINNKTDKNNFNSSSSSSTSSNGSSNNTNNYTYDSNDSKNEQASTSLWIGNVDPSVTEENLIELFSAYGSLANVRCLPEKYCAFVNFKIKEDAQKAMKGLQVNITFYINQVSKQGF